jgi:ribosomal protein S18 acetylase RimI-like enzyme
VGYIIGTPDTLYFAERWRETFASAIDQEIVPPPSNPHPNPLMETPGVKDMRRAAYDGECSMLQSLQPTITQALEKYPAHLHINLLPEFQRKGWGGKLMDAFFAEMRGLDVRGVHLGVLRQSKGSIRFYEKMGWRVVSVVLDGGESGEVGVSGRAVCLVKDV